MNNETVVTKTVNLNTKSDSPKRIRKKYGKSLSNNTFKKFTNKFTITNNLFLIIPFILITLIFVVIPLIVILVNAFTPGKNSTVAENWGVITGTVGIKIGKSTYISIVSTILTVLISFPFAYGLSMSKNKIFKVIVMLIITAPVWTNLLIKLIGLKTLFDLMNHAENSTYGPIFTILGLTYLYIPFMIIPLYTALESLPKNLINASKDLGRNSFYTFFAVILPWCKQALISGVVLVLLPCFTTVAVPSFLNNDNNGGLIGNTIIHQGENGLSSKVALSRTSVLALVVSAAMFVIYGLIVWTPKLVKVIRKAAAKK
ncbi:ABC transporter permease [Ureaplasma ceti]|uniref:ABC transporter permease n=1 Tax=Ureaplasma ceti TaxID=3119530 RepID=A0ABP9U6R3_9BACT